MQTAIAKWGNSLALRLPRNVAADARLYEGTPVELRVEGERLVIVVARPKYRLADLLAQLKPEHAHGETDWGPARGEEEW
jgi:antitoxin MazE